MSKKYSFGLSPILISPKVIEVPLELNSLMLSFESNVKGNFNAIWFFDGTGFTCIPLNTEI
jgi:hypothetical protein